MHQTDCQRHGFTLIELLVTIAILILLMGLLLPALWSARQAALRRQAHTEALQVETCWKAYFSDYRRLPGSYSQMDEQAVLMLRGDSGQPDNPNRLCYLEFSDNTTAGFLDPWGTPYQVALDSTGANQVMAGNHGTLYRHVAVWSLGPNGVDDGNSPSGDDIVTWGH